MSVRTMMATTALLLVTACDGNDESNLAVGLLESDRVEVATEFAESIVSRAVAEGDVVAAGDLLITLDTARIEARLAEAAAARAQARARLDELVRGPRREQILAAQASVRGAEQELEFRETELERAIRVYERNLAAPELRDRARVARDTAQANLQNLQARLEELLSGTTTEELSQAEAALRQAEARFAALELDRDRHRITAPVDGMVDSLPFETGERPLAGQPIAIVLRGSQPYARVFVPERLRAQVSSGTSATVRVDGVDGAFDGRVRWVRSEAAFTPYFALTERDRGRLTYEAKVDILDAGRRLPDGVPVEVDFALDGDGE